MCVVLQDPIIFSGTVRANLDPYDGASTDASMWAALKQAGLKRMVQALPVSPHCSVHTVIVARLCITSIPKSTRFLC